MRDTKDDDDEISINSERNEDEEKSISEKLRNHCDKNQKIIVNATFTRRRSISSNKSTDKGNTY